MALTQYDEMRNKIGIKASEHDPAKEEITAHFKKIDERLERPDQRGQRRRSEGAGRTVPRGPSSKKPSRTSSRIIASIRSRAQQDVHLVARPHVGADGEPVAARRPSSRSIT